MAALDSRVLGYTTLRLAIGVSMLVHGLNRIGDVRGFAEKTARTFAATWLPQPAVLGFGYSVPPVELIIGLLVLLGVFTQAGLLLGGLWMVALIFGSTVLEQYDLVGIQLIYALIFSALLYDRDSNVISVDGLIRQRRRTSDH